MPLEREEFKEYIRKIKEVRDKEDEFTEAGRKYCYDFVFAPPNLEYELVSLLQKIFGDTKEIEYFIYELDFGANWKPGCVTYDGKDIKLATVDDLYDAITTE